MSNMIRNTFTLFSRHKEYVSSIIKSPILMLLIFSFILSFQSKINIALIDKGNSGFGEYIGQVVENTDLIKILNIKEEDIQSGIQSGKIEFAIVIGDTDDITIIKSQDSEVAEYMEGILAGAGAKYESQDEVVRKENEIGKKGIPIGNSLGMVTFKMLAAASLLAELIIMERKNGILHRIFMSKTKLSTYLTGRGVVFFLHILVFIACYYITAVVFHFDFGMKDPIRIVVVFMVMGIFTTAFGMFLSAFLKNEGTVWNVGVLVLLPTSILSGALFPFETMPKLLRTIGGLFPQRFITSAVEILQDGKSLMDAAKPLTVVLIVALFMFVIAGIRLNKGRK